MTTDAREAQQLTPEFQQRSRLNMADLSAQIRYVAALPADMQIGYIVSTINATLQRRDTVYEALGVTEQHAAETGVEIFKQIKAKARNTKELGIYLAYISAPMIFLTLWSYYAVRNGLSPLPALLYGLTRIAEAASVDPTTVDQFQKIIHGFQDGNMPEVGKGVGEISEKVLDVMTGAAFEGTVVATGSIVGNAIPRRIREHHHKAVEGSLVHHHNGQILYLGTPHDPVIAAAAASADRDMFYLIGPDKTTFDHVRQHYPRGEQIHANVAVTEGQRYSAATNWRAVHLTERNVIQSNPVDGQHQKYLLVAAAGNVAALGDGVDYPDARHTMRALRQIIGDESVQPLLVMIADKDTSVPDYETNGVHPLSTVTERALIIDYAEVLADELKEQIAQQLAEQNAQESSEESNTNAEFTFQLFGNGEDREKLNSLGRKLASALKERGINVRCVDKTERTDRTAILAFNPRGVELAHILRTHLEDNPDAFKGRTVIAVAGDGYFPTHEFGQTTGQRQRGKGQIQDKEMQALFSLMTRVDLGGAIARKLCKIREQLVLGVSPQTIKQLYYL